MTNLIQHNSPRLLITLHEKKCNQNETVSYKSQPNQKVSNIITFYEISHLFKDIVSIQVLSHFYKT